MDGSVLQHITVVMAVTEDWKNQAQLQPVHLKTDTPQGGISTLKMFLTL
jgi:hypothetical protein